MIPTLAGEVPVWLGYLEVAGMGEARRGSLRTFGFGSVSGDAERPVVPALAYRQAARPQQGFTSSYWQYLGSHTKEAICLSSVASSHGSATPSACACLATALATARDTSRS
jgi:hypothetical protein